MITINNPRFRFLLLFISSITIWFLFYHYIYKIDQIINLEIDSLTLFSKLLSEQSNFILQLFGFPTSIELHGDMVVTKITDIPNNGVWIGEPCNGIKVFGLFSLFILCFNGEISHKIWFIPIGILFLHILNIIRISCLTYIAAINPMWLNFNHNITFQLIIYGAMTFLWLIWINKFSMIKLLKQ